MKAERESRRAGAFVFEMTRLRVPALAPPQQWRDYPLETRRARAAQHEKVRGNPRNKRGLMAPAERHYKATPFLALLVRVVA